MFVNVADELVQAKKGKYAIGAFNTANLEVTKAICQSAIDKDIPIIIQTTPSAIEYAGLNQLFSIVKTEIESTGIKAALHLDHAKDFETVKDCIDLGYKSVMIDGSKLKFEENVALTKRVVEYARMKNVSVEGEIGALATEEGGSADEGALSTPEQTQKFVELTGVDSVAISVGNQHGAPEEEKLDLSLLAEIARVIDIPLVLHGSSGLSDQDIKSAIGMGVAKINIDTLIRRSFLESIEKNISEAEDYRDLFRSAMEAVCEEVKEKINLFGNV